MTTTNSEKKQHIIDRLKAENAPCDLQIALHHIQELKTLYWKMAATTLQLEKCLSESKLEIGGAAERWHAKHALESIKDGVDWVGFGFDHMPVILGGIERGV